MQLQSKAWVINPQRVSEPWFCPDNAYYGNNVAQVRSKALSDIDGLTNHSGESFTWLTVPLMRAKHYDKYLVDGKLLTLQEIETLKRYKDRRERLNALLAENPNGKAYIRKGGSYYRPNCCGYTESTLRAGVYSIQEAVSEVLGCDINDRMDVVLIDPETHNSNIQKYIEDLKTRIIPQ